MVGSIVLSNLQKKAAPHPMRSESDHRETPGLNILTHENRIYPESYRLMLLGSVCQTGLKLRSRTGDEEIYLLH
jgi:hypothetical protein